MKKLLLLSLILGANMAVSAQKTAEIFLPNHVSTNLYERDMALAPDGKTMYFTIQLPSGFQSIAFCKKDKKGKWTTPEVAPFSGMYSDLEPAFSPDGKKLFFASNRPITGTNHKDFDIWYIEKNGEKWSEPVNAGNSVNTSSNEFYPSVSQKGDLYFTATKDSLSVGKEDIYKAEWKNGKYANITLLDTEVNTKTYEFNAFVAPDESYIIFSSYGRKDDKGRGDLYMSIKDTNGKWKRAVNLSIINTESLDYCPFVSPDGKTLYFTNEKGDLPKNRLAIITNYQNLKNLHSSILNGGGNIYSIDFSIIREFVEKQN
jgi:Tol biopolymer transport system component